jgi:chromosomal replication initiator protein
LELSAHRDEISAWRAIQTALRHALGESMYSVWIDPVEMVGIDGDTLVLRAPPDTEAWLSKRYGRVLDRCVRQVLGERAALTFAAGATADPTRGAGARRPARAGRSSPGEPGEGEQVSVSLNPRYSFDQFIIGDSNRMAHAAALAVAELPGQAYNPLFLNAPPGLGKTHLVHAIGNYVLAYGGGTRVRYTTAEAFTNHFISSLASRSVERFKRAYRDVDVLLIDDVQFLASKAKTEEEFFHTFNAVYDSGRQLVLTADRLPARLEGIAERLRERFQAGLVVEIDPPDPATRVGILRKRAALDGIPLAEEGVLEAIAARVTDNVRALEGALIRVVAYHSLTGHPIDLALTERVLDGMQYPQGGAAGAHAPGRRHRRGPDTAAPSIATVQAAVAAHYGLSVDELVSPSRAARVAWPRQLAIHLARELTGAPLTAIGQAFGGRNHATVLHACRRVVARVSNDQQAAVDVDELARELRRAGGDRTC